MTASGRRMRKRVRTFYRSGGASKSTVRKTMRTVKKEIGRQRKKQHGRP